MDREFNGLEIVSNRPEQQFLEETESDLIERVKSKGLETVGGKDAGIQFSNISEKIDNEQDLLRYIDHSAGLQCVDLAVYASKTRGSKEVGEEAEAHISLDPQQFLDAYKALEQDLNVRTAGFNITGYGEGLVEAYESAVPMVSFLLEEEDVSGVTVSYRDGGSVETIWSDSQEVFRDIYTSLFGLGLGYDGAAVEGEKDSEWMVADHGYEGLDGKR